MKFFNDVDYVLGVMLSDAKKRADENPEARELIAGLNEEELEAMTNVPKKPPVTESKVDEELEKYSGKRLMTLRQFMQMADAPTADINDMVESQLQMNDDGEISLAEISEQVQIDDDGQVHLAEVTPAIQQEDTETEEEVDKPTNMVTDQWTPKYEIGTRIVNVHTRREGIIIDISKIARQYIVQYEGDNQPEFATDADIATPEEFYKPLNEEIQDTKNPDPAKVESQLTDLLFNKDSDTITEEAVSILEDLLTNPEVAPRIIEKMLDKGLIDTDKAVALLQKVGALPTIGGQNG